MASFNQIRPREASHQRRDERFRFSRGVRAGNEGNETLFESFLAPREEYSPFRVAASIKHEFSLRAMNYIPKPIDTARVTLTSELTALTERLAENAHDLWAKQRLADGWSYGPKRDDAAKKHPCLVPYAELPESEREYDRNAAMGTLKAILALGYRIEPKPRT